MKKIFLFLIILIFINNNCQAGQSIEERKKEIFAVYNSNNLQEAYNMISTITEEERDYELWYLLGNLSQDFNNDMNAAYFFQKSILMKPDFDKAHYNLANLYLKEKKYNKAIQEYKTAIKYKKDFPYIYQKEFKEAKEALQKAIKLKNNEAKFYYNLAIVYKNLNNIKEAKEALSMYNNLKDKEDL